ncbi:hypothetical protein BSS2_I1171 [Brucella suis bv. 1 str. S2]|uniref:Uncharacterized protein n=5 Tax=Brucella TaxID=234 RepID=A9M5L9_BRUC2|nr:hypothetical protein BR1203 [Brucella suis 1330]ABQ61709.1 hypothetical protein BOV_1166 [Brucella ovis ATCC 25840]ABX62274.1 Hypothetical protein, conserved [Brucella canis ATCC 23365]ACU48188.1 hypothetical protein BMI_I1214 [Brucella microti CCM 4915]AEK54518.1 hypothetical protein BPI_I1251 [Brucella pinnipedialis B2/94]AEU06208.1 hypothetical protein BSVBI22_A1199 [Brucella suis VBI22]AEW15049.1 hypothetical protein BCA52141_I3252 [Brucella canis HSK A52141]AHN46828.1 hypothetical pr
MLYCETSNANMAGAALLYRGCAFFLAESIMPDFVQIAEVRG